MWNKASCDWNRVSWAKKTSKHVPAYPCIKQNRDENSGWNKAEGHGPQFFHVVLNLLWQFPFGVPCLLRWQEAYQRCYHWVWPDAWFIPACAGAVWKLISHSYAIRMKKKHALSPMDSSGLNQQNAHMLRMKHSPLHLSLRSNFDAFVLSPPTRMKATCKWGSTMHILIDVKRPA